MILNIPYYNIHSHFGVKPQRLFLIQLKTSSEPSLARPLVHDSRELLEGTLLRPELVEAAQQWHEILGVGLLNPELVEALLEVRLLGLGLLDLGRQLRHHHHGLREHLFDLLKLAPKSVRVRVLLSGLTLQRVHLLSQAHNLPFDFGDGRDALELRALATPGLREQHLLVEGCVHGSHGGDCSMVLGRFWIH